MIKEYTISYLNDLRARDRNPVPYLRLSGKWLEKQGFGIGTKLKAVVSDETITLTKRR